MSISIKEEQVCHTAVTEICAHVDKLRSAWNIHHHRLRLKPQSGLLAENSWQQLGSRISFPRNICIYDTSIKIYVICCPGYQRSGHIPEHNIIHIYVFHVLKPNDVGVSVRLLAIDSGNGLYMISTKPLPESMLPNRIVYSDHQMKFKYNKLCMNKRVRCPLPNVCLFAPAAMCLQHKSST